MDFRLNRLNVLIKELSSKIIKQSTVIDGFLYCDGTGYYPIDHLPFENELTPYIGQKWGAVRDKHAWFIKEELIIPNGFNASNCEITVKTSPDGWFLGNPQILVYVNGVIKQALDYKHCSFHVDGKNKFSLAFYAYIGEYIAGGNMSECCALGDMDFSAYINEYDPKVKKLYYDILVPLDALDCLETSSPQYNEILNYLYEVFNVIDFRRPHSNEFYDSIERAQAMMDKFYQNQAKTEGPLVTLIGQTHIDVAWLWTKRQVVEKAIRSFATALDLLDRYPEYNFMMSQPALYEYVKYEAPELYIRIKDMVSKGRWEPEGGLWVESDCNLISGESMVRQLVYGKNFMKKEFGVDCKVAWLPDTFGFSGALPQIFKKAGIESFVTSKLTWNEVNTYPYDSFNWKGIDGSKIFGYFLTAQDFNRGEKTRLTIYNARLTVTQVFGTVNRYEPKRLNNDVILTYGFGDGGGGPTEEYMEVMQRLNKGINGVPRTESGTLGGFMDKMVNKLADNPALPEWSGELYFEHHRGTYTSISRIKKNNRKAEFALMCAENDACLSKLMFDLDYPSTELCACWKKVLTNQFHDVLPGSSVKDVYKETDIEYIEVFDNTNAIFEDLCEKISPLAKENKFIAMNYNSKEDVAFVDYQNKYYKITDLPAKGYKVIDVLDGDCSVIVADNYIENEFYKVVFDENYEIASIFDKRVQRELLKPNTRANVLRTYEDYPGSCDAWELQHYYTDKSWKIDNVVSVEKIYEGVRAGYKIVRNYLDSTITQSIVLYSGGERIDFDTVVDWSENSTVLKAEFPFDINFNKTVADMQFGFVERPAHTNTSWDEARFETCAHKYVDVSDGGYGVSLLNDCKYGYDVLGGVLKLTILKCASFPYPNGDKGVQKFTYALYPHDCAFDDKVIKQAYQLNNPIKLIPATGKKDEIKEYSLVSTDKKNIFVEIIKKAEQSEDIIVRFYEGCNKKTDTTIKFGFNIESVMLCDLMENDLTVVEVVDNSIKLQVKPFELVSLKLKRK